MFTKHIFGYKVFTYSALCSGYDLRCLSRLNLLPKEEPQVEQEKEGPSCLLVMWLLTLFMSTKGLWRQESSRH